MVRYLFLLRLLVGFHLLHFSPPPLAAGVATPLTSFPPPYGSQKAEKTHRGNGPRAVQRNPIQLCFCKKKGKDKQLNLKSIKRWLCPQEQRSGSGYDLILAQVFSECWRLRVVRNPEPAAYSGGFSDTVFTRHEEVGALQQTAPYTVLSIISHSIHENRSTAGSTVWTTKL